MLAKTKTTEQKRAYTTVDSAKDTGVKSPAVVRRILRTAAIKKPTDGWSWPDKTAAKDALAAVQRVKRPEPKKPAWDPTTGGTTRLRRPATGVVFFRL